MVEWNASIWVHTGYNNNSVPKKSNDRPDFCKLTTRGGVIEEPVGGNALMMKRDGKLDWNPFKKMVVHFLRYANDA